MQISPPLCKKGRRTKESLDESERGEWKVGLKLNIQKTKIMASGPITSWQIDGEMKWQSLFSGAPKSLQMVTAAKKLKDACSLEEKLDSILNQHRQHIKKHLKSNVSYFANKSPSSQSFGFSSSHIWMWELDYKESWAPKSWWFWTVVLEKTLEIPLDCKEIKPVSPKGDQSWIFIWRTNAEAETPVAKGPPDVKNWLIWKDSDAEKDWRWEEKGTTGWDGWMASLTQWTWVWVSSGSWWWTGRPGVL